MNNTTKTQTKALTKKEAKEIEATGEARNLDAYKSRYEIRITSHGSELDEFNTHDYIEGEPSGRVHPMTFHGSQN